MVLLSLQFCCTSLKTGSNNCCQGGDELLVCLSIPGNTTASVSESARWQEWLMFADLFYYLMSTGYLDFLDFIDKLAARFATGTVMPSNHVTWLLAQVFRLETVSTALSSDSQVAIFYAIFGRFSDPLCLYRFAHSSVCYWWNLPELLELLKRRTVNIECPDILAGISLIFGCL